MKSMGDPDYVYRPWTEEQREAARQRGLIRIYGSERAAKKAHALMLRRDKLQEQLDIVKRQIKRLRKPKP